MNDNRHDEDVELEEQDGADAIDDADGDGGDDQVTAGDMPPEVSRKVRRRRRRTLRLIAGIAPPAASPAGTAPSPSSASSPSSSSAPSSTSTPS